MRNKLLFMLLVPLSLFAQSPNERINQFSKNFDLDSLYGSKISFTQKFKSAISEDTSIFNLEIFQFKNEQTTVKYKINFLEKKAVVKSILFDNSFTKYKEYYFDEKSFIEGKRFKKTSYYEVIDKLINIKDYLVKDIQNTKLTESTKFFQFFTKKGVYKIFKNYQGYIYSNITYSNLGFQFLEETVNIIPLYSKLENEFNDSDLFKNYTKFSKTNFKEVSKNEINTKIFDSLFQSIRKIDTSKSFFIIDMFYQSCLPCVKSIPILNNMKTDSIFKNCLIVGVDPIQRDTLNMEKFIKRYNINYDILKGEIAELLSKRLNLSTYPTTLILNNIGQLIYLHNGLLFSKDIENIKSIIRQ